MARLMRMLRSGAAGAAIALWAGAAMAMPAGRDARQASPADREAPEDYAWIDRADALWDAIGDAPPDYSFVFQGSEPWAWETADRYWIVVEDTPEGMRGYYFEPDAEGPFLARAAGNSFGYDDGQIAMVYDAGGGAMPAARGAAYFDEGERLYDRGVSLRRALRQRNWRPVNTTAWVDLSFVLFGLRNQWDEGRRRHPGWRRHRELPHVIAEHRRWDGEQRRRAEAAARFRRWREGGYQGAPPGRPGGWAHGPNRPGRPDGAGRPGRPGGQIERPPLRPPAVRPIAPTRPMFRPRPSGEGAGRPGIDRPRPTRPVFTPRAAPRAAPTGAPPTRPTFSPPPVSAPTPRPAHPPKIEREDGGKVD